MLTRRTILAGLLSATASPALANVQSSDRPRRRPGPPAPLDVAAETEALIVRAGLGGEIAFSLIDARDGAVLLTRQPDLPLPPASVLKSVTAAYALDFLGPGHRFATRLIATGPLRDGLLEGDLVLVGGGAPALDSAGLDRLAEAARDAGLRAVGGRFAVWDGALPHVIEIEPGQPDHLAYNPSLSGLNLNYNRVHFRWRRAGNGYATSFDAEAGGVQPASGRIRADLASRAAPIYRHGFDDATGQEVWSVARRALGSAGSRWLPVRDPTEYAADVFRTLAQARGITLPPPGPVDAVPDGAVLASHVSEPLAEITEGMLRFSNNLTAEILGLSASAEMAGAVPQSIPDSAALMTGWAQRVLGMNEASFLDHSGLSGESRATPADLTRAFHVLGRAGPLRPLLRSYTLRDQAGAVAPMQVRAKTGTLNFVSSLAGHITPDNADAPPMIFAILTAELARRAAIPKGDEANPPGTTSWTRRSRALQLDLVRLWGQHAGRAPIGG